MFLSLSSNFGISKTFTPAVAETPGEEAKVKADLIGQARDFLNEELAKVLPVEADVTRREGE